MARVIYLRTLLTKSLSTRVSHLGRLLPTIVLFIHVCYLLSYFPPQPSLNRLLTLLIKSLPITALVIYVSYFPPYPSLSHLCKLLTKSLPKALRIYVRYLLVYFPRQPNLSHRCKLLVNFPPQPSLRHRCKLLTSLLPTTA